MTASAAEPAQTPELNREEVAAEAYKLSVARAQRGAAPDAVGDWFEAEAIVRARMDEKRQAHAAAAARVLTAPMPESARPVTAAGKAAAKKAVEAKAAAKSKPAPPPPAKSSGKGPQKKK